MWRIIDGYEDYEVSDKGEVRRIRYADTGNSAKYKLPFYLKGSIDKDGYIRYALSKNSKSKSCFAHRLVATAFIENPMNKEQINHINGIKSDNRIENLEWCTSSENIRHRIDVLSVRLTNNRRSKPVVQLDFQGKLIAKYPSAKEAKRQTGFSQGHISECCRGEIPYYHGYVWKYVD